MGTEIQEASSDFEVEGSVDRLGEDRLIFYLQKYEGIDTHADETISERSFPSHSLWYHMIGR